MANTHTKKIIYRVDDKDLKTARRSLSDTGKATKDLEEKTERYRKEVKNAGDQGAKSFLNLKTIIASISVAAIVAGLKQLGSRIIQVGAEFQKMEAVLTNTLGSRSRAQIAMAQITQFAARTPFQVNQLTAAFVKLANQGFVPTTNEMRKLGDIAASTGKDFDMLAEAIIDAQVGEFERLKEFGIRASKHGDQVTFAFKGIKTEVEFTQEAIRDYIVALGDAEGVSGAMAAISKTMGGAISNLGDQWTQLLNNMSKQTSGPVIESLRLMSKLLEESNEALKSQADRELDIVIAKYEKLKKTFQDITDQTKLESKLNLIYLELEANRTKAQEAADMYSEVSAKFGEGSDEAERYRDKMVEARTTLEAYEQAHQDLLDALKAINDENLERDAAIQRALSLYPGITQVIRNFNRELDQEKIRQYSKSLQDLGKTVEGWAPSKMSGDEMESLFSDIMKDSNKAADEAAKKEQDRADKDYNAWKETYDAKKELQNDYLNYGIDIVNQLAAASIEARQLDWHDFQLKKEEEMALAGNNAEARAAIERRFNEEEAAMRRKQAEEEKKATVRRIMIDTAANVVRSILNNGGVPAGLPFGAIALAMGLAQAATVRGFKHGVIDLSGPGTGTSDSIPARLSKGESVITARSTARSKQMLQDIQAGKLDDKTYKLMMSGSVMGGPAMAFDDKNIVKAIDRNGPPDYQRVGSVLYESRTIGEGLKRRIRKKVIN